MAFTCNTTKWVEANMPPNYNPNNYCAPSPYWSKESKFILAGLRDSIDPMMQAQLGLCGTHQYLDGGSPTSTVGKYYCAIVVIRDTILNVAALQTNEIDGAGADVNLSPLAGATLPAGTILLGNYKKVVIVSGHVKLMAHPFL